MSGPGIISPWGRNFTDEKGSEETSSSESEAGELWARSRSSGQGRRLAYQCDFPGLKGRMPPFFLSSHFLGPRPEQEQRGNAFGDEASASSSHAFGDAQPACGLASASPLLMV